MPGPMGQRLVVDKQRLRTDFHRLRAVLEDYRAALLTGDGDDGGAVAALRREQMLLLRARVSLGVGELGMALLREVLRRLPVEELHFRLPPAATAPAEGATRAEPPATQDLAEPGGPALRELIAALGRLSESAPLEMQEKLLRTLANIQEFFTALAEQQVQQAHAALARVNLATSNAQSRNVLREIALVTRDVYETLQGISADLPLEALSGSTGGIREAVERLNSVLSRLDDAATQNLDNLEKVNALSLAEADRLGAVIEALRNSQRRLMQLKEAHPELADTLTRIQDSLSDEVGGPAMTLQHQLESSVKHHMELMSNQSFQELTGRTLRKIMAFVETLQTDLFELLSQFRPGGFPPPDAESAATPASEATQSQSDVDKLLGELGF